MFHFSQGRFPLLVSFPHSSPFIPAALQVRMTERGRVTPDTDWFLPRLYAFLNEFEASILSAAFSRYVIDPNRSTDGINLYPGQPTPQLCPVQCFDGRPIYVAGREPDALEIAERTAQYWQPYHDCIHAELSRMKQQHGLAVLLDLHSILSRVPRLFDGRLPDINIGTARGAACDATLAQEINAALASQSVCSHVMDGRFVGGHITRAYGQPEQQVHAVQVELVQARYMDESSGQWDDGKAAETQPVLRHLVEAIVRWTRAHIKS